MSQSSLQQSTSDNADIVYLAAIAVAVGAFGVFVTSILYGLSPIAAALPIPDPSLESALSGMKAGGSTLVLAGRVGFISDIILVSGMLLLMVFRSGLPMVRVGWALATIGVLIFVMVDALAAGVLTQVAARDGAATAFAGFKLLFDTIHSGNNFYRVRCAPYTCW